jgi:hypothetical protein
MLGRMIIDPLILIGTISVAAAAVMARFLGGRVDARNIEHLRRHYGLDPATAERLYRLARRDGFGSAWQTVIEGRPEERRPTVEAENRTRNRRTDPSRQATGRRLADRPRA